MGTVSACSFYPDNGRGRAGSGASVRLRFRSGRCAFAVIAEMAAIAFTSAPQVRRFRDVARASGREAELLQGFDRRCRCRPNCCGGSSRCLG
jgi:hypothetical protein